MKYEIWIYENVYDIKPIKRYRNDCLYSILKENIKFIEKYDNIIYQKYDTYYSRYYELNKNIINRYMRIYFPELLL